MTLKEILELGVPIIAYLIIFLYQRQKIGNLTDAITAQKSGIEGQKAAIDAQTAIVTALKTQADGQGAITTRLEGIVDRTERQATTILANHDKVVALIESAKDKEKQLISDELKEAQDKLSEQEKNIQGLKAEPEIASILHSLSQENYATKEVLASLRTDLAEFVSSTNKLVSGIQPILATPLELELRTVSLPASAFSSETPDEARELYNLSRKIMRLRIQKVYGNIIKKWMEDGGRVAGGLIFLKTATGTRMVEPEGEGSYGPLCKELNPHLFHEYGNGTVLNELFRLGTIATAELNGQKSPME